MYKVINGRDIPVNVMNLQLFAGSANIIDRTGAEALIPEQTSREIIQGVTEQSTVLALGKKLPNMSSNRTVMPDLDMLPVAYFVNGDTGSKKTNAISSKGRSSQKKNRWSRILTKKPLSGINWLYIIHW